MPSPFFTKTLKICLMLLLVAMSLASVHPIDWDSYLMHQAGTLVCIAILLYIMKKTKISQLAIIGTTVFLLVHILGARYLYSYTPYSDWTQAVFGFSLDEVMGWQRNMYDRLVHFCYGFCLFPLFFDLLSHYFPHSSRRQLIFLVILLNMSTSMLYELIEWQLAMGMSAEDAENYNGQQGDLWDAHKDMTMALVGGLISGLLTYPMTRLFGKYQKRPTLKLVK